MIPAWQAPAYPPGDTAEQWRRHYAAIIGEVLVHKPRPLARLTFVIVAYNTANDLLDCLRHCAYQSDLTRDELQIVLVDNGGNESVREQIGRWADVEIRMRGNIGACSGRNVGVAYADAPVIGFVDDDGLVRPRWAAAALKHLADPATIAVRGRIFFKRHPYFSAVAAHYDLGDAPIDDLLSLEGNTAVRCAEFLAVGGFPENLWGGEGLDLAHRWLEMFPTRKILYVPDLVMRHDYADSWRKFIRKARRYHTDIEVKRKLNPAARERNRQLQRSRRPGRRRLSVAERCAAWGLIVVEHAIRLYYHGR